MNLRLYVFVAILGGFLFGYDTAVINGAMPFFRAYFNLTDAMLGWSVSSGLVGCILGAYAIGRPADTYGRRDSLKVIAMLFFISAIGVGAATTFTSFVVYRIIGGVAVGAVSVVIPIYMSEVAPASHRGRLTVNFQLGVVIGILLAFFVGYFLIDTGENNWRYMFYSMAIPALLMTVLLFFVCRSPRWLIQKSKLSEARMVLSKLRNGEDIEPEIKTIKDLAEKEAKASNESLWAKANRSHLTIGVILSVFSQFTGIAIVMYYATDIFRDAGFDTSSAIGQTVIIGLTNLIFTLLAKSIIDKIGRKILLLWGSLGMSVILGFISLSYLGLQLPSIALLIALVCYVALFASSMGAVIWVILAEMFPTRIRSKAMSICSLSNWATNGLICFLFPIVSGKFEYGIGYCFGVLALLTFMSFFFVKRYIKETKMISLEDIEDSK